MNVINEFKARCRIFLQKWICRGAIIFLVTICSFNNCFSQEGQLPTEFDSYCLYADTNGFLDETPIEKKLATEQYLKYDFSKGFAPRKSKDELSLETSMNQFLGLIGQEYQRLYIVFTEVKKDKDNPKIYRVEGYTKVKGSKNNFSGNLTIEKILVSKGGNITGVDNIILTQSKAGLIIFANYEFFEDKNQKFSGKFQGKMWLGGFIDMKDQFFAGDNDVSDQFNDASPCPFARNNQYVGTWQSYKTSKIKIANWGQNQIPGIKEEDDPSGGGTGCGGNKVDLKYNSRGWSDEELPPKC